MIDNGKALPVMALVLGLIALFMAGCGKKGDEGANVKVSCGIDNSGRGSCSYGNANPDGLASKCVEVALVHNGTKKEVAKVPLCGNAVAGGSRKKVDFTMDESAIADACLGGEEGQWKEECSLRITDKPED